MSDWADSLCESLDQKELRLAEGCHLRPGMTGPEFEQNLGLLLRWQQIRHLESRFEGLGGGNIGEPINAVTKSRDRIDRRMALVMETLNATLFREFGQGQVDDEKARKAYGLLLDYLERPDLILATTNYDGSAEAALVGLGLDIDTGFRRRPSRTPILKPQGLVTERRGNIPAIHLHGAVGWYERDGNVGEYHADLDYNPSLGSPVVLYPDPDKDPTHDATVNLLWAEFQAAVDEVDSILVVGHSLHDPALVRVLKDAAGSKPVVITYLNPEDRNAVLVTVPGAAAVPMDFGPELATDSSNLLKIVETGRAPAYLNLKS
jgi:hypothetical protein